jgi:hypothetical protein
MSEHDEDGVAERLRMALHEEARATPLPYDFAAEVVAQLPERSPAPRRSRFVLPAAAVVGLVAVAVVALVGSLTRPTPSLTPGVSTGVPGGTVPEFTHYSNDTLSFDYPADWRIIEEGIETQHYRSIAVVLGTGDWRLNCVFVPSSDESLGGVSCGPDSFSIQPGGVVVVISTMTGPPVPDELSPSPPPGAVELPSGVWAEVLEQPQASTWRVYAPGWMHEWTVEARYSDPRVEQSRAAVERLVESLEWKAVVR